MTVSDAIRAWKTDKKFQYQKYFLGSDLYESFEDYWKEHVNGLNNKELLDQLELYGEEE